MILTLTMNPAVDQTVFAQTVSLGEVNRYHDSQLDPAGKGINVSRMVHRLGWPTLAFGFVGGEIGQLVQQSIEEEGVPHHFVPIPGQTRLNVTIVDEATGMATSFYGPGPAVDDSHRTQVDGLLEFWLRAARVLVLAGSLPAGVPDDAYATYIRLARVYGVRTILDADGRALRNGMEAKPYMIKPNVREAERLLDRKLPDVNAVLEGAVELANRGISVVVVSMGDLGSVCVQGEQAWRALPPAIERRSTVGSGDSLVAGLALALARGEDILDGLRIGTAAGAATAMTPGTALGTADEVHTLLPQVRIEELPL